SPEGTGCAARRPRRHARGSEGRRRDAIPGENALAQESALANRRRKLVDRSRRSPQPAHRRRDRAPPGWRTIRAMAKLLPALALSLTAMLAVNGAEASFHTFVIETIYSNADGTVQFVVLRETQGFPGENLWATHSFTSTHAGVTKTFPFGTDL